MFAFKRYTVIFCHSIFFLNKIEQNTKNSAVLFSKTFNRMGQMVVYMTLTLAAVAGGRGLRYWRRLSSAAGAAAAAEERPAPGDPGHHGRKAGQQRPRVAPGQLCSHGGDGQRRLPRLL